jgi:hypothetical protein
MSRATGRSNAVVFEAKVALSALAAIPLITAGAAATTIAPPARTYSIPLTAEAEVNSIHPSGATGDTDGSGLVELTVDPQRKRICYAFRLSGVATPLMAHIHKGTPSRNGPTVITHFTGPDGDLANCVAWTKERLAEIVSNASNFYVNLYTTEFPDGALRGQLAG